MTSMNPPPDPELDALLAEPPVWPKVVGIISICLGSLFLLCGGCGLASSTMQGAFTPPNMPEEQIELMEALQPNAAEMALQGFGLINSLLLLGAGIATVSRKPSGRMLHIVYGLLSFVSMIVYILVTVAKMGEVREKLADSSVDPAAMMIGGLVIGLLIGSVYPLFCLIWFGLVKRKPEDMTGTGLPPAA